MTNVQIQLLMEKSGQNDLGKMLSSKLGYFWGKLGGRKRIAVLLEEGIEILTDLHGLGWVHELSVTERSFAIATPNKVSKYRNDIGVMLISYLWQSSLTQY